MFIGKIVSLSLPKLFPFFLESRSVLVAILGGKPQKFVVNLSQQLLKRERTYFRTARGQEIVTTIGYTVVKKRKLHQTQNRSAHRIFE